MKAAAINQFGPPEVLTYQDLADPRASHGEIVIKVEASGINHYDLDFRHGAVFRDITFPHVIGADVAGTVAQVGDGVHEFSVGDRVIAAPGFPIEPDDWGMVPENRAPSFEVLGTHTWGGYAEYVRVPARFVLRDDTGLSCEQIAAMPLVTMTALHAVRRLGEVIAGQRVLVQNGASGSGNCCIQVARALGATVATTVGGEAKLDIARHAGASLVIDHQREGFVERLLDWTNGAGVDVVIDNVGASLLEDNLRALKKAGIFVNFGLVGGVVGKLNMKELFFNQHQLRGSFMGTMEDLRDGMRMLSEGRLRPFVDRTFALSDAAEAHRYIYSRGQGKGRPGTVKEKGTSLISRNQRQKSVMSPF